MKCKTLRPEHECIHQRERGCLIEQCSQIIDKCVDCKMITEDNYCKIFVSPKAHWIKLGGCPGNTNKIIKEEIKHKLNPMKASKKKGKRDKK